KVGMGRQAWLQGAENHMYLRILEAGRGDELKKHFVDNMWLSIRELDEFVRNPKADPKEREAAERILARLAKYFAEHPKKIEKPKGTGFASEVKKQMEERAKKGGIDKKSKKVMEQLATESEGVMKQAEGMFDGLLMELYKRDLETQAILDRRSKREAEKSVTPEKE
ncbi:MAG: hypothetical protein MI807_12105, partial [Verrucomicrobiales bacterium]|nr:hypothetical protein [Verrucomicrobiales bacterium]